MKKTNSGFSTRSGNEWGFDVSARAIRQAAMWTVHMTTKKGNLSMAKTLRSRIAAVAVAAVGLGLLQAVPAFAAVPDAATLSVASSTTTGSVGSEATVSARIVVNSSVASKGDAFTVTPTITTKPVGSGVSVGAAGVSKVGLKAPATYTSPFVALADTAASKIGVSFSAGVATLTPNATTPPNVSSATEYATLSFTPDMPGVYTFTLTANTTTPATTTATFVIGGAAPTVSGTATLGASWNGSVFRSCYGGTNAAQPTLTVTKAASDTSTRANETLRLQVLRTASSALLPAGTILGGTLSATASDLTNVVDFTNDGADNSMTAVLDATGTTAGTDCLPAGLYEFLAFKDTNLNGMFDSGEAFVTTSVRLAGAAASYSLSLSKSAAVTGDTINIDVTISDGTYQTVLNGSESITLSSTTQTITTTTIDNSTRVGALPTYRSSFVVGTDTTATQTISATATLGGSTVAKTATFSKITPAGTVTKLSYTGNAGIYQSDAADVELSGSNTAGAITVDLAKTTVYFTVTTGTAGDVVAVTTAPAAATTNGGSISTNGVTYQTTLGDGTVTFPVTFTSPVNGRKYTITAGAFTYTVTYADPAAAWTVSPGASIGQKTGTDTVITATLKDVFGRVLASKAVSATVAGRNPAQAFTGTTDANGVWTFTVKDTSTATLTAQPSDTVTLTYNYTNVAGTASSKTQDVAITYAATAVVADTVVVTAASTSASIDQTERVAGAPATGKVVYTATVKDADGAAIADGTVVTFSGSADDIFLNGIKTATTSGGVASVTVYRQKAGYANITATAGGKSGNNAGTLWSNLAGATLADGTNASGNTDARNVVVSADQSVVAGGVATVTATVTDRWGNPVSGVLVTWSNSGVGRGVTGADSTVGTDLNGKAQFQITSLSSETGTATVTATIGSTRQAVDAAGFVYGTAITGVKAGNYSASSAVKFTAAPAAVADPSIVALTTAVQSMMTAIQVMMTSLSSSITKLLAALAPAKKK